MHSSLGNCTPVMMSRLMINYCIPQAFKPGSQYDAGASVASQTSRASSAKTGVPVHNLAFASVGGVVEGVSEGGSLYETRPWRSKISATSASHAQRKR